MRPSKNDLEDNMVSMSVPEALDTASVTFALAFFSKAGGPYSFKGLARLDIQIKT